MHAQGLKQQPAYCFLVCHDVLLRGCEVILLTLLACMCPISLTLIPQPESDKREREEASRRAAACILLWIDTYILLIRLMDRSEECRDYCTTT